MRVSPGSVTSDRGCGDVLGRQAAAAPAGPCRLAALEDARRDRQSSAVCCKPYLPCICRWVFQAQVLPCMRGTSRGSNSGVAAPCTDTCSMPPAVCWHACVASGAAACALCDPGATATTGARTPSNSLLKTLQAQSQAHILLLPSLASSAHRAHPHDQLCGLCLRGSVYRAVMPPGLVPSSMITVPLDLRYL